MEFNIFMITCVILKPNNHYPGICLASDFNDQPPFTKT